MEHMDDWWLASLDTQGPSRCVGDEGPREAAKAAPDAAVSVSSICVPKQN